MLGRGLVVIGVAFALTVLAGCGGASKHTITGHMVLSGSDAQLRLPVGSACDGRGGYSDIDAGTPVSIANDAGKLIATGHLDAGSVVASLTCSFPFTIKGVPDSAFYRVTISHRGELSYSKAELSGKGWKVEATLGS
jgi:hypothetical protein